VLKILLERNDINSDTPDKHGQTPPSAVAGTLIEWLWPLKGEQILTLNEDYQTFMENHYKKLSDRRKRNLEALHKLAAANAVAEASPIRTYYQ